MAEEEKKLCIADLEALLFTYGELLLIAKAAKLLGTTEQEVLRAAQELKEELASRSSGLTVLMHTDGVQLVTALAYSKLLETVFKAEMREGLTPAALETLAIITYSGPIGRPEIDFIRGVNSTFSIRALLLRGLIDRSDDPERPNAYRYGPSVALLQHLGVTAVGELPEYERFRALVTQLRAPTQQQQIKEEQSPVSS